MRWYLRLSVLGLLSAVCTVPGLASDGKGSGKFVEESTCGNYGTSVHFEKTPKEAAKKALQEEKLVFVVHVSGLFEEPDFT